MVEPLDRDERAFYELMARSYIIWTVYREAMLYVFTAEEVEDMLDTAALRVVEGLARKAGVIHRVL